MSARPPKCPPVTREQLNSVVRAKLDFCVAGLFSSYPPVLSEYHLERIADDISLAVEQYLSQRASAVGPRSGKRALSESEPLEGP